MAESRLDQQAKAVGPRAKTKRDGLYVHPKGKLSKQIKVSCASCISGHRSGECNHFDRILLQIRAAGRPSNTCHHSTSCGGACLLPKAFVIPGEDPKWCRNHRSCIENWEYSDYCPPYPVSTKRKVPSSSPSASGAATPLLRPKDAAEEQVAPQRRSLSSCCEPHGSGRTGHGPSGPVAPLGQPIMVNTSLHASSAGNRPAALVSPFALPSPSVTSAPESELFASNPNPAPMSSIPQTSGISDMDAYAFIFPQLSDRADLFSHAPYNEYITDSASFQDDLATARLHHFAMSAPLTSAESYPPVSAATSPAITSIPSLQQPLTRTDAQEPQQCPGNGFQCPCDENCMCVDCYTHTRGFWTLPVNLLDNVQDAITDYQAPPLELSPSPPAAEELRTRKSNSPPSSRINDLQSNGNDTFDDGSVDPQDPTWNWR